MVNKCEKYVEQGEVRCRRIFRINFDYWIWNFNSATERKNTWFMWSNKCSILYSLSLFVCLFLMETWEHWPHLTWKLFVGSVTHRLGAHLSGLRAVRILGQQKLLTIPSRCYPQNSVLQHFHVLLPLSSSHSLRRVGWLVELEFHVCVLYKRKTDILIYLSP